MRRFAVLALIVLPALVLSAPARAQDETLADIRQELNVLYVDIQRLKRELSTTGGATGVTGGNTVLERVDLLEAELSSAFPIDGMVGDEVSFSGIS